MLPFMHNLNRILNRPVLISTCFGAMIGLLLISRNRGDFLGDSWKAVTASGCRYGGSCYVWLVSYCISDIVPSDGNSPLSVASNCPGTLSAAIAVGGVSGGNGARGL